MWVGVFAAIFAAAYFGQGFLAERSANTPAPPPVDSVYAEVDRWGRGLLAAGATCGEAWHDRNTRFGNDMEKWRVAKAWLETNTTNC